eukprot:PLAT9079.4.p1 GENE.PLAT9079.4~~PLAT9079.4.p1  ORF type:complete len:137 (+),score=55.65 PLAT9079.4:343-753(+)
MTSSYYRGAHGVIMVYDVTRRETFENLEHWLQEVETYSSVGDGAAVKVLVGNQIDRSEQEVPRKEAIAWARSKGMLFLESSAKSAVGIEEAFREVCQKILENPVLLAHTKPSGKSEPTMLSGGGAGGGAGGAGGCC